MKLCTNRWATWAHPSVASKLFSQEKTVWNQNFGSVPSSDIADAKYHHNILEVVFPSYLLNFCSGNHSSSI